MRLLEVETLTVRRGERRVVDGVSMTIEAGECVGLIGPNGAGKTTLLRAALGLIEAEGTSSLAALAPVERARRAAFLPQGRELAWPMAVETVVELGRIPHLGFGAAPSAADRAAVDRAIARLELEPLRARLANRLSGGELARVLIARALAQDTELLVADEPTAGLDPGQALGAMEVFQSLARSGRGVLVSLHDLNLAGRFCDRLVLLHQGRALAVGAPEAVITPEALRIAYEVDVEVQRAGDTIETRVLRRARDGSGAPERASTERGTTP